MSFRLLTALAAACFCTLPAYAQSLEKAREFLTQAHTSIGKGLAAQLIGGCRAGLAGYDAGEASGYDVETRKAFQQEVRETMRAVCLPSDILAIRFAPGPDKKMAIDRIIVSMASGPNAAPGPLVVELGNRLKTPGTRPKLNASAFAVTSADIAVILSSGKVDRARLTTVPFGYADALLKPDALVLRNPNGPVLFKHIIGMTDTQGTVLTPIDEDDLRRESGVDGHLLYLQRLLRIELFRSWANAKTVYGALKSAQMPKWQDRTQMLLDVLRAMHAVERISKGPRDTFVGDEIYRLKATRDQMDYVYQQGPHAPATKEACKDILAC